MKSQPLSWDKIRAFCLAPEIHEHRTAEGKSQRFLYLRRPSVRAPARPWRTSHDNETVTVTMPSLNGSIGNVAFDYDGSTISERQLGLESSEIAQAAAGNPDAWIGESPYAAIGWDALDELRRTLVVGSQEMTLDGGWIVGSGCQPHMCSSDFSAIAIHRESGGFLAAVKRDGERPRLLGSPAGPLPVEIRKVMTAN